MILRYNKTLIVLLAGLLFGCGVAKTLLVNTSSNEILFSPIPEMVEVFQGTSTKIFLSAIDDHLENVRFTAQKSEKFLKITDFKNGSSELLIAAPKNKQGVFPIQILLTNGTKTSLINFKINIRKASQQVYYCAPSKVVQTGTGTYANPFSSLEQLMASDFKIPSGALILLLSGRHGSPIISGNNFTIAAANGQQPTIENLSIKNANTITISGLAIGKECTTEKKDYLVTIDSSSSNITIQNCLIVSNRHTENWTASDWHTKAANGILCQGKQTIIQNNLVQNIFHGIETENENIVVQYNTVDRFSGDAIRNISSNNRYAFNVLKNATLADYYEPSGNHDDLFQSWTYEQPIENIQLVNNIAISCLEPNLPMKSKIVQGLVCFDGFEKNWVVKNNLVLTDHPHGIALYGADNCLVTENTVLRNPLRLFEFESAPWIMINDHKDKRKSIQNIVSNNIVSALNIVSEGVDTSSNTIIDNQNSGYFKNYEGWDFRPKALPSN